MASSASKILPEKVHREVLLAARHLVNAQRELASTKASTKEAGALLVTLGRMDATIATLLGVLSVEHPDSHVVHMAELILAKSAHLLKT